MHRNIVRHFNNIVYRKFFFYIFEKIRKLNQNYTKMPKKMREKINIILNTIKINKIC